MNTPRTKVFHQRLLKRDNCHAEDLLSYERFAAKLEKETELLRYEIRGLSVLVQQLKQKGKRP